MRNIKITALLLAVLMIVTAFAGCASNSTVSNLDDKVNDLDNKIQDQEDLLNQIKDTLDKISGTDEPTNPDDLKQEIMDDILGELNKDEDDDELKTAISRAGAQIEALRGEYEDNKVNYTEADFAAIREILGDAQASISACTDAAAVQTALDDMAKKLAAYVAVNDEIYDYVVALTGNIDDDAAELVEEAEAALKDAKKFYKYTDLTSDLRKNLTEYAIGANEQLDLVVALQALIDAYDYELPQLKLEARNMENVINNIKPSDDFVTVTNILASYKVWAKKAADLSEKNVALVSNYDALLAAHASALNASTAKTMYAAETIKSTLAATYGNEVSIFADYDALLLAGEQVVFTYDTKSGTKIVKAFTSKIYDAIDAKIAAWAEEYELTDAAVEYIIDTVMGVNHYYDKYNSNKALVKAFEAAYEDFAEIADDIKALNGKKLAGDAINVVTSYKENAEAINAWAKALTEAYAAELKADTDAANNRTVDTAAKFAVALQDNFNAMIYRAELGVYIEGTATVAPSYSCWTETNVILADIKVDTATTKAYYHNLYDFDNAEFASFLSVTYKAAQAAADAINKKIADLPENQAHSIIPLVTGVGGYVKAGTIDGKTALVEITANEMIATLYGTTSGATTNTLITTPDTIAEFVYAYNTNVKYDLSALIDSATYEAKLAKIEANVAAADAALKAINDKYVELLGGKGVVVVNMDSYAGIIDLYNLLQAWIVSGHANMVVATKADVTAAGVQQYTYADIEAAYDYATDAYMNAYTGLFVELRKIATALKNEADLVVNAYNMIATLNKFGTTDYNALGGRIDTIKGVAAGTIGNLGNSGVTEIVIGEPAAAAGTATTSQGTESYAKGERLWTIKYATFTAVDTRTLDVNVSTKTLTCYVDGNDINAIPQEVKDLVKANMLVPGTAAVTDYTSLANEIFTEIPADIKGAGSLSGLYALLTGSDYAGKVIADYQLPAIAMALEAKFEIDNGASYKAIEDAKAAAFDLTAGYGFTYTKAMSYVALNAAYGQIDAAGTIIRDAFSNKVANFEALQIAVESIQETLTTAPISVIFGDADSTWLSAELNIEDAAYCKYNPNGVTFAELGIDLTKRTAEGVSVYDANF